MTDVLQYVGAFSRSEAVTSRPLPAGLRELLTQALVDLQRGRAADGAGTVQAMEEQLTAFSVHLRAAAERAPQLITAWRERLLQRVHEFVQAHVTGPVPAVDMVREVAMQAMGSTSPRNCKRLDNHVTEIRNVFARGGEVGRHMSFLLQELLRETNTLTSPDSAIAHTVVAMWG